MPIQVVPVIDLKRGQAVHAVGGRRDQYQPLWSIWQASACPEALAGALYDQLGSSALYLADLDAIEGRPPQVDLYCRLSDRVMDLWIDAGLRAASDVATLLDLDLGNLKAVVGLETLSCPEELPAIVDRMGADRTIFSLDLFEGLPRIAAGADWGTRDPLSIAFRAIRAGVGRLIVLDLARVGGGRGPGTHGLLADLRSANPRLEIIVGGGISTIAEILELEALGASTVLIGSAIHEGRIGRRELDQLAGTLRAD